jgi:hypothetical protein
MFRTEGSELVKGSMLALTIDAILDFAGERSGHFRMIECEVSAIQRGCARVLSGAIDRHTAINWNVQRARNPSGSSS